VTVSPFPSYDEYPAFEADPLNLPVSGDTITAMVTVVVCLFLLTAVIFMLSPLRKGQPVYDPDSDPEVQGDSKLTALDRVCVTLFGALVLSLAVLLVALFINTGPYLLHAKNEASDRYDYAMGSGSWYADQDDEVIDWAETNYGINLFYEDIQALLDGELITPLGSDTIIKLEGTGADRYLVGTDLQPLQPVEETP